MKCENCGAELAEGLAFCTQCGTPVPKDEPPARAAFCMQCGAPLQPGASFCIQCGATAGEAGAGAQATVLMSPVASPAGAQASAQGNLAGQSGAQQATVQVSAPQAAPASQSADDYAAENYAEQAKGRRKGSGAKIGIAAVLAALLFGGGAALALLHPWAPDAGKAGDVQGASASQAAAASGGASSVPDSHAQGPASSGENPVASAAPASSDVDNAAGSSSAGELSQSSSPESAAAAPKAKASAPDVAGKTEDEAKSALADAGLELGVVTHEHSDTVEKGRIISQNPGAGAEMEPGTSLALVVSDGKAEHRYEFVSGGYTWSDACKAAEDRGGYLVCIGSEDEWNKVLGILPADGTFVVWAGAQRDSSSNFSWISGEGFGFNRWASGEPNNEGGGEDKLCLLKVNGSWAWYDTPNDIGGVYESSKMGFVVEYED